MTNSRGSFFNCGSDEGFKLLQSRIYGFYTHYLRETDLAFKGSSEDGLMLRKYKRMRRAGRYIPYAFPSFLHSNRPLLERYYPQSLSEKYGMGVGAQPGRV